MRRFFTVIGCALMLAMVVTPVTHNALKLVPLAVVLVGTILAQFARGGRLMVHRTVLAWFLFYVAVGGFFVVLGYLRDAPGTLYVAGTYLAFPLLYLILVEGAHDLSLLKTLLATAVVGGMFTCVYMLDYALWAAHIMPSSLFFVLDEAQNIAINGPWIQMRLYAIAGLTFLVPYVGAALVVFPESDGLPLRRRWFWVALVLGLIGTLLSGRRALFLTVMGSPFLMMGLRQLLPAALRARSAVNLRRLVTAIGVLTAIAVVYLPATGHFDWNALQSALVSAFDVQHDAGANERLLQTRALVGGWSLHPFLGWGWGQGPPDFVRSDRPWEYEIQYALMLFSTGIVGVLLYASGMAWIYAMGVRIIRTGGEHALHMIPLLVGMTSILLAHASNPYLVSGGNAWMLFLPVAMINSWLLERDRQAWALAEPPRPALPD